MKVALLSDYELRGGAAIAAGRLGSGLVQAGCTVTWITKEASAATSPWTTRELTGVPRFPRIDLRLPLGVRSQRASRSVMRKLRGLLAEIRPDVVSVHNLHGATEEGWSMKLIDVCLETAPVVWTLHDMWSFTGGCAYSFQCRNYLSACNDSCFCPDEYPKTLYRSILKEWRLHDRVMSTSRPLVAAAPSRWLVEEAGGGLWGRQRVEHVPYGLPLDTYFPVDRSEARSDLGLDHEGLYVLVAADDLSERRKGGLILEQLFDFLAGEETKILVIGKNAPRDTAREHVIELGYLSSPEAMRNAYSAADLLLHPAPVDNLPNVVLEALACGTPVVAMPAGGIPDMVLPGRTGWLADEVSLTSLQEALHRGVADVRAGVDLRVECRDFAVTDFGLARQAERYMELFSTLLAGG